MSELEWAAGFFDGEGHARTQTRKDGRAAGPRVQLGQSDPEVLYRFQKAVGAGKVYGPYGPYGEHAPGKKRRGKYWQYQASHSEAVIVMRKLLPLVCSKKKRQLERVINGD